jgi:DNA-directed RNA polymerase specialized sigma24 family protein
MTHEPFRRLIQRVRDGDVDACEALVRDYGGVILREARARLGSSRVRSLLDSQDVCQSVLKSFLFRVSAGQYALAEPAQLVGLLVCMTRNKVVSRVRRERKWQSDISRRVSGHQIHRQSASDRDGPEQVAIAHELLDIYRQSLVKCEWDLLRRRLDGHTWPEISRELGESSDALRKRLMRALDRVGLAPAT